MNASAPAMRHASYTAASGMDSSPSVTFSMTVPEKSWTVCGTTPSSRRRCPSSSEAGSWPATRTLPRQGRRYVIRGQREGGEDSLGGGHRPLHGLPLLAQRGDGLEEALHEQHERGQRAQRYAEGHERGLGAGPQQAGNRERG